MLWCSWKPCAQNNISHSLESSFQEKPKAPQKESLKFVSSSVERRRWIKSQKLTPLKLQDMWNSKLNVVLSNAAKSWIIKRNLTLSVVPVTLVSWLLKSISRLNLNWEGNFERSQSSRKELSSEHSTSLVVSLLNACDLSHEHWFSCSNCHRML